MFDAVASLLGIRDEIRYEGQAAVELEQQTDPAEEGAYAASASDGEPIRIRGADLFRAAVEDLQTGLPAPRIAARFHNGLVGALVAACGEIRRRRDLATVALTGGVFQNALLLERTAAGLSARGFRVLTHRRVPCNDGGISFGQAAVAAARQQIRGASHRGEE